MLKNVILQLHAGNRFLCLAPIPQNHTVFYLEHFCELEGTLQQFVF